MPYVLSAALVLILSEHRQTHIRLRDLCTPPPNTHTPPIPQLCQLPLDVRISHGGAPRARPRGWRPGSATPGCVEAARQRLPRRHVRFVCELVLGL